MGEEAKTVIEVVMMEITFFFFFNLQVRGFVASYLEICSFVAYCLIDFIKYLLSSLCTSLLSLFFNTKMQGESIVQS